MKIRHFAIDIKRNIRTKEPRKAQEAGLELPLSLYCLRKHPLRLHSQLRMRLGLQRSLFYHKVNLQHKPDDWMMDNLVIVVYTMGIRALTT